MRCIAVINQKGGVGKTTSTVNIGAAFARAGKKVLLLDCDPQANLTLHLDRRPEEGDRTMTELLVEDVPLREIIQETSTEGLYMVSADTSLSAVETQLANRIGREMILREALEVAAAAEGEPQFEYVFLDCPPSLGVLSANALVAAEHIVIPMQAEYFSMQGMTKLMEVMELVRRSLNPTIDIALILPCMVDRRTNLTNEVLTELRRHFGDVLADGCIRSNVKLAEAPSFGRTIFEHAADSNGAHDYLAIADELMARLEGTYEAPTIEEPEEEVAAVELGEEEEVVPEPDRAELEAAFADAVEGPAEPAAEEAPADIAEVPAEPAGEEAPADVAQVPAEDEAEPLPIIGAPAIEAPATEVETGGDTLSDADHAEDLSPPVDVVVPVIVAGSEAPDDGAVGSAEASEPESVEPPSTETEEPGEPTIVDSYMAEVSEDPPPPKSGEDPTTAPELSQPSTAGETVASGEEPKDEREAGHGV